MKIIQTLLTAIIICMSSIAFGQNSECQKFKNGKFKMLDAKNGNWIFERKGSKQIEYSEGIKLKVKFKVKWINDCTYTLQVKKIIENPNNINFPVGMILTVEMIEIKEHSYIQKTTSNLYDTVLESELFKIE